MHTWTQSLDEIHSSSSNPNVKISPTHKHIQHNDKQTYSQQSNNSKLEELIQEEKKDAHLHQFYFVPCIQ